MKIITQGFGRSILAVLSFSLVVGLLFGVLNYNGKIGLPSIMGSAADETTKELDAEQTVSAETAVMNEKRKAVPVIVTKKSIKTGETYDTKTVFCDVDGNAFESIRIISVAKLKDDGELVDVTQEVLDSDRKNISFPSAYAEIENENTGRKETGKGTYQIRVTAVASDGTQQTSSLCVGVRKGA